jgi:hypothetical protein
LPTETELKSLPEMHFAPPSPPPTPPAPSAPKLSPGKPILFMSNVSMNQDESVFSYAILKNRTTAGILADMSNLNVFLS